MSEPVLDLVAVRLARPFSQTTLASSRALRPTLYQAADLYDRLDISGRELHDWMRNGLPYQQDARGQLWFEGRTLAAWLDQVRQSWPERPLGPGEAYCLRCRRAVPMTNPAARREGRQILHAGRCPSCGCPIHREAAPD